MLMLKRILSVITTVLISCLSLTACDWEDPTETRQEEAAEVGPKTGAEPADRLDRMEDQADQAVTEEARALEKMEEPQEEDGSGDEQQTGAADPAGDVRY